MKSLYIDCIAGASGDMLLGAMIDLGVNEHTLEEQLKALNLPGFKITARQVSKNGIQATKFDVGVQDEQTERHLPEIIAILENSDLDEQIKAKAKRVIRRLGEVEAKIHNAPLDKVHLHELGGIDTIVDIVGFLLAIDMLGVERITCSPLPVGHGFTACAHGRIPLPAPATIALLEGIPIFGAGLEKELVTPTGAALLSSFVDQFGAMPHMQVESVGYGAGTRDLEIPNIVRMLLGQEMLTGEQRIHTLTILETNIDDVNPEIYGYLMERLFASGARDVTLIPVYMKKNRPGTMVQVAVSAKDCEALKQILFEETSTLGIRQYTVERDCLPRHITTVETEYGAVKVKIAELREGKLKSSPEYEDCKALAEKTGVPLRVVMEAALQAINQQNP